MLVSNGGSRVGGISITICGFWLSLTASTAVFATCVKDCFEAKCYFITEGGNGSCLMTDEPTCLDPEGNDVYGPSQFAQGGICKSAGADVNTTTYTCEDCAKDCPTKDFSTASCDMYQCEESGTLGIARCEPEET